jgi:hypothetical protein
MEMEIQGELRIGDCIFDERFLLWMIFESSLKFRDLVASIEDSDGQFLLIHAAEFLPNWLDPSNADGRVFIKNGKMHLVQDQKVPLN